MRLTDWQMALENYLLTEHETASRDLAASLIGGPTLDVNTGLRIYHNAYRARLLEVLRGDFPAVWHWLGDTEFEKIATAYINQTPSTHFSLRWFSEGFEQFVRQHLVPEQSAPLAELIALEWKFTLAFDAPDEPRLTLEDMARLPLERWPALRVRASSTVQVFVCTFNSLALWRAVKEEAVFPTSSALDEAELVVIWRAGMVCHYRSLTSAESIALNRMIQDGWSFADLCHALEALHGEGAALLAATWLKQWVHDGWLVSLT